MHNRCTAVIKTFNVSFIFILLSFAGFAFPGWVKHPRNHQSDYNTLYLPPKIFRASHIKSTMLKVVDWQLKHPNHAPTDWTNGAFYAGVVAAYQTTKSKMILDSLMALGDRTGWKPGRRYDHADDIAISQTYIDLYRMKNDRSMIQATVDS